MTTTFPFEDDLSRQFITFVPQPLGSTYLSEEEALVAAGTDLILDRHPDAQVAAWSGLYTFALPASVTSSGQPYAEHESHPVWLICFDNVTERFIGRGGGPVSEFHETWVVIDAKSGKSLRRFSFR